MKKLLGVLLTFSLCLTLVACGDNAAATSGDERDTTVSEESTSVETVEEVAEEPAEEAVEEAVDEEPAEETVEESASEVAEEAAEEVPATSAGGSTNWEDYLDGNVWDLTGYAEALGYTWIPDPEWDGLAMYMIEHNGIRYFFCFSSGLVSVYYGDAQGRAWHTSGIEQAMSPANYVVRERGQEDWTVSSDSLSEIVRIIEYLATPDMDITHLPAGYTLTRRNGVVSYYSNGMIRQRDFADMEIVESISIQK